MDNKHWRGVLPSDCVIVNYGKERERESLKKKKERKKGREIFFSKEETNISNIEFIYLTNFQEGEREGFLIKTLKLTRNGFDAFVKHPSFDRNSTRFFCINSIPVLFY